MLLNGLNCTRKAFKILKHFILMALTHTDRFHQKLSNLYLILLMNLEWITLSSTNVLSYMIGNIYLLINQKYEFILITF